jgi:CubicO group peptidase (beta-lactamase class C family)
MTSDYSDELIRNPDLDVDRDNTTTWNRAGSRRWGFRNVHWMNRQGLIIRPSRVLPLRTAIKREIGMRQDVQGVMASGLFSGMIVAQGRDVLFERYADDFGPAMPHSIQSITKTTLTLIIGRLVAEGRIDLTRGVEEFIPEIGSGYRGATVQQVLDMNVMNNFDEDYEAPYDQALSPEGRTGYGRQEISGGWRLPPDGQETPSLREFLATIADDGGSNAANIMHYKSPNTDVAAWLAERVSGRDLKAWLRDITEAAGLEHGFHMTLDRDFVPVLSGGGSLTLRDLARFGLLHARYGRGVDGVPVGDEGFLRATMQSGGTQCLPPREHHRYHNQIYTDGTIVGHGGFAGQYLMARPDKEAVFGFFSTLENTHGSDPSYLGEVIPMAEDILASL